MAQWGRWSRATIAGRLTSRPTRFSATSKVVGGDEGAGTKSGSALGEHERVLPLLAGARSRFLEHRAGDPDLAMPEQQLQFPSHDRERIGRLPRLGTRKWRRK